jgi:hypothetical protein
MRFAAFLAGIVVGAGVVAATYVTVTVMEFLEGVGVATGHDL